MLICPLQFDIQYTGLSTKTSGHALAEHRAANFDKLTLHSTGKLNLFTNSAIFFYSFGRKTVQYSIIFMIIYVKGEHGVIWNKFSDQAFA